MRQRHRNNPIGWVAVIGLAAVLTNTTVGYETQSCIDALRRFADTVVERGTDVYGQTPAPLFVDGLHIETLEPARWKGPDDTWVLSNFASQQSLMRLLDGLTALTDEPKYRRAAEAAAAYALKNCRGPNGLLYWGGHLAWDLEDDKPVGQYADVHELKTHQPYYRLMWRVDPDATRTLCETLWATHILDWSRLDYNRHAGVKRLAKPRWDHTFDTKIDVPFPTDGGNLSFVNVTPPLMHAGVTLAVLDANTDALLWTHRLLERWQEAEDKTTGLSGGQLSYRQPDRAQIALGHVHPRINEAKIVASYHQSGRYHDLPLAQMQAAIALIGAGGRGAEIAQTLIAQARDDLRAYDKHCYDPETGRFIAVMIDGTPLKWRESTTGYYIPASFAPQAANGSLLWGCALGYRLTRDGDLWDMTRRIARQRQLGDIGRPDGADRELNTRTSSGDFQAIYALLELNQATSDDGFLQVARRIADNLLKTQAPSGLFPRPGRQWARTGDDIPLALLHLAAAESGKAHLMPPPILDRRFFHCQYHGDLDADQQKRADDRTYDHLVFYGE